MSTNFPVSLDVFVDPTANSSLSNPLHSTQHANANDAIAALEAKVGIDGSTDPSSLDYLINHGSGSGGGGGGAVDIIESDTTIVVGGSEAVPIISRAAITGDVNIPADSNVSTLSAPGAGVGTYGDDTHVAQITLDASGRVTSATSVPIDSGGVGTLISVDIATANGFTQESITSPNSAPVITLGTTVNGVMKGNGTSLVPAVPGTDFLQPTGSGAQLTGITQSQISGLSTALSTFTSEIAALAPISSPTFTGTPKITSTPSPSDNSTTIADTAYVTAAIAAIPGGGGGGGVGYTVVPNQQTSTTAANGDYIICNCASNAITITAPAATSGYTFWICKVDGSGNQVTVVGSPNTVEINGVSGASPFVTTNQWQSYGFISDGTQWIIFSGMALASNIPLNTFAVPTGNINMDNFQIINLAAGAASTADAANMTQV